MGILYGSQQLTHASRIGYAYTTISPDRPAMPLTNGDAGPKHGHNVAAPCVLTAADAVLVAYHIVLPGF